MNINHKICSRLMAIPYWLSLLLLCLCFSGCSLGKYGTGEPGYLTSKMPNDLRGKVKTEIVSHLGIPEYAVVKGDTEYWRYCNSGSWWFYIPLVSPPVGIAKSKNLVLEFHGDKVTNSYLWDGGFSFGLYNMPGAVAN